MQEMERRFRKLWRALANWRHYWLRNRSRKGTSGVLAEWKIIGSGVRWCAQQHARLGVFSFAQHFLRRELFTQFWSATSSLSSARILALASSPSSSSLRSLFVGMLLPINFDCFSCRGRNHFACGNHYDVLGSGADSRVPRCGELLSLSSPIIRPTRDVEENSASHAVEHGRTRVERMLELLDEAFVYFVFHDLLDTKRFGK